MRAPLVAVAALVLSGCSADAPQEDTVVDVPTLGQSPTTHRPGHDKTGSSPAPAAVRRQPAPATVDASFGIERTAAEVALVRFIEAHAESVIAGRATPQLEAVSTTAELNRQRSVIDFAVQNDYTVPDAPRVAVVSAQHEDDRRAVIGVCLWLPSTEYVDLASDSPANAPVPRAWAPAVATLTWETETWKVDTLMNAGTKDAVDCGGLR